MAKGTFTLQGPGKWPSLLWKGHVKVNSSKIFAYNKRVIKDVVVADIPLAQSAPVEGVTHLRNVRLHMKKFMGSLRIAGLRLG